MPVKQTDFDDKAGLEGTQHSALQHHTGYQGPQ